MPQRRPAPASAAPAPTAPAPIVNAMSVDVEDYFQVSAFAGQVARDSWGEMPCRIERNIEIVLEILREAGAKSTFFTLGWIAERYPGVVRSIAAEGHELASHGYGHQRVTDLNRSSFMQDLLRAKGLLEDTTGQAVLGYRAPSFSIGDANPWAFDCILETGHRYSSSVYPIRHDHYGSPASPRFAHAARPGLLEIPITTVRVLGNNFPAGGGGYFRLLPYRSARWLVRRVNQVDRRPAMFYFHPWEIDPDQPRIAGAGMKSRFRHYLNLHQTERRLRRLLSDFRWDRADRVFLEAGP